MCSSDLERVTNQISNQSVLDPIPEGGEVPDEAELLANEMKHQADLEMLAEFLDADDKLQHLYDENSKLKHQVVTLELRINGLLSEKNLAVKMVKDHQRQLDRLKKQNRAFYR